MDWTELRSLALKLRGVFLSPTLIRVGDRPCVRLVDPDTVAFALADARDRDALIAAAPAVFSITKRFEQLPVVLAKLASLDVAAACERLRVAWEVSDPPRDEKPRAAKPEGPRLFMLVYIADYDRPERRKFKVLGRGHAIDWLLAAWRAHHDGRGWGEKLPDVVHRSIEFSFESLAERELSPADSDAREVLMENLHCTEHYFSEGDDFEGTRWTLTVFDEKYLGHEDSDYLPHPDRGESRKNVDDGYRALLAKHGKHRRTARR